MTRRFVEKGTAGNFQIGDEKQNQIDEGNQKFKEGYIDDFFLNEHNEVSGERVKGKESDENGNCTGQRMAKRPAV